MRLLKITGLFLSMVMLQALVWPAVSYAVPASGTVRVALIRQADSLSFKTSGNYSLVEQSTGQAVGLLNQNEHWQVRLNGDGIEITGRQIRYGPFRGPVAVKETDFRAVILAGNGQKIETSSGSRIVILNGSGKTTDMGAMANPAVKSAAKSAVLSWNSGLNLVTLTDQAGSRRYRGSIQFMIEGGRLTAVNELNIEDYLRGVVPSEMPSDWPAEALKAQAVAARNYALQRVETSRGRDFNLTNDQFSQVYKGYDAETPFTNRAVDETRGMVMLCQGSIITAFFHSSSGGYIENSEDVWLNPLAYIKHKEDPYDRNERHYNWQVRYSAEQLMEQIKAAGYEFSKIDDIEVLSYTSSGARVERIMVRGLGLSREPMQVEIAKADRVRIALGLKSALFTIDKAYDKDGKIESVSFYGNGWGHGLGLSQWGAHGMAAQGYKYQDILKYYYSGIVLSPDYGRSFLPVRTTAGNPDSSPWVGLR